ncbi:MAG: tetratricopeptide repeat protein [Bacteroidota bacterium]
MTRIISLLLLNLTLSATAQTGKPSVSVVDKVDKAEAGKWREDLRFMAQEMPKRHKNLFHTMTRQQFDDAVGKLDERIPSLARHQIIVDLARIVAAVGDGHTGIGFLYSPTVGFRYYPLALYLFKDGLFVYAADPQYRSIVGGRVITIGNATAGQAIEAVRDLIHRDNDMTVKERVPLILTTPEVLHALGLINDMEEARFVVEQNGRQTAVEIRPVAGPRPNRNNWALGQRFSKLPDWIDARAGSDGVTPLWLEQPEDYFRFTYLDHSQTMYVQFNDVANKDTETVADFARRVFAFADSHPVDRFVLDLRWNTGGNNYLNKPLLLGIIKSNKIDQRGRLFAIIGRRTFSAAQNLVNDLEKYTNVMFVGEPTAGNPNFYGDPTSIILPNSGIVVRVSTLWWQDLDSRDTRQWTGPHIAVELASEDYRTNRDPVLRTILDYVPKKDLAEILMDALTANDVPSAVRVHREFKADPTNAYVNTEGAMNNLGYRLMGMKRLENAIEVFKLNVASYPKSANAYDSLAEAYMVNGNKELAITNYERSLELNPANSNAVEMLTRLKQK